MHRIVPSGAHGEAKIDHFTIDKHASQMANMGMMFGGQPGFMRVEPGKYARLHVGRELMMTDTPMERRTNAEFVRRAHGRVLVAGLGLGMVLRAILKKPEVEHVTVLEKSADVVALVEPTLKRDAGRLTIVTTDVHDWRPEKGAKWNVIYFDIWPDISTKNLPEMGRLQRRAASWIDRTDPDRWVGCWLRDFLLAEKARYR